MNEINVVAVKREEHLDERFRQMKLGYTEESYIERGNLVIATYRKTGSSPSLR